MHARDSSVDIFYSFRGRQHDCIVQYMSCKGSKRKEKECEF